MSTFEPSRFHRKPLYKDIEVICYFICCVGMHTAMMYTVTKLCKDYSDIILENASIDSSIDPPWYAFQLLGAHGYDNTDAQWRSFSGNINILLGVLFVFLCGSRYIRFAVDRGYKVYNISSVLMSSLSGGAANRGRKYGSNSNNNKSSALHLLQEAVSESVLNSVSPKTAPPSAKVLPYYYTIFGVIFVTYIYGPRVIFMMVIFAINYIIIRPASRILPYYGFMCVMWGFNISLLFLNQYYDGYKFCYFIPSSYGGAYLDELSSRKELMSWHVNFNMAILRMIAYCYDYREAVVHGLDVVNDCDDNNKHYDENKDSDNRVASTRTGATQNDNNNNSCFDKETYGNHLPTESINKDQTINTSNPSSPLGKLKTPSSSSFMSNSNNNIFITNSQQLRDKIELRHKSACLECLTRKGSCCYKARTDMPRHQQDYSFINYCAYLFYVPLLIAGPMSSYNGFISHIYHPQRYFKMKDVTYYGAIILILWTIISAFLHFMHLNILRSNPTVLQEGSSIMKFGFFYYSLLFVWFKFAIMWKFFRLVALIDGVETPEDLPLCSYGFISVQGFWREWHTSFNTWIVRYMYIPLGGSKRRFYNIIIIFIFIALWHDLDWSLLYWALLVSVILIPEITVITILSGRKFNWMRESYYFRFLRGFGCMASCTALLAANFIGFRASGQDDLDRGVFSSETAEIIMIGACFMYLQIQISWYFRDVEFEKERKMKWTLGIMPHRRHK